MSLTIGLIAARSKPEAIELGREIGPWLDQRGCRVLTETQLRQRAGEVDVLVTLGGDGLIMRVAHLYPDTPILGINVGKVGFLAMIEREGWQQALIDLIDGRYQVQEGPTLAAHVVRDGEVLADGWAINDVVIRAGMQMIDIELYVDQQFVNTYPGDGMIVATPQGSTAYCMAAGGPVLTIGVRGFALTPICPHSPIRTTSVVPEESLIELVVANDHRGDLILDGIRQVTLQNDDLVQVRQGPHRFLLVLIEGMNFYQAFRSKFNFMIRPGTVPTRAAVRERADQD